MAVALFIDPLLKNCTQGKRGHDFSLNIGKKNCRRMLRLKPSDETYFSLSNQR
ncbi:hypothetical protein APHMUC_0744 [Anaplasma phagocytophilum str. ApMUC09]|uniref:Uncharacterized protein n=1 Tax=Anaplasma phagocytophilum str. ApMUC09 TaxID=1359152 RepID=A0A0F3N7W6_ANAPH|nr:hypothetical protein APHMUC_0744 [Anaplasma phagocytophilum str. ApMUC09]